MERNIWTGTDINYVTGFVKSDVSNYYGYVAVWEDGGRYFMGLENHDGWNGWEVSAALYNAFAAEWGAK